MSALFEGHTATQVPQPMHNPGLTRAVCLISVPVRARISAFSTAWYGQVRTQAKQAAQVFTSMCVSSGLRVSSLAAIVTATLLAAAEAGATVSGISLGAWQAPHTKTPAALVSTGRNLGCD